MKKYRVFALLIAMLLILQPVLQINAEAADHIGAKSSSAGTGTIASVFTDVKNSDYYAPAVEWAYVNGVTSGTTATAFSPNNSCTRGQVVTFLWRASGSPEPKSTQNPFSDVAESKYYYKAVLWAVEEGITAGTTATTFAPNNTCSNAHILTFLWRAQGKPGETGEGSFYSDALKWAKDNNLLEETTVEANIKASCPRANVVTFLYRVLDEKAKAELQHEYGDWTVTQAPTCITEGIKARKCTDCGFEQTRPMETVDHSYKAATCSAPQTCSVCGATAGEAKGHSWIWATCSAPATCKVCGITTGKPKAHNYENGFCTGCGKKLTAEEQNAVKKEKSYLDFMAFSRSGLIDQLEYEGFSEETATTAVNSLNVDWNEQAVKKADSYLDFMAFSRSGLIDQLEYEGFDEETAAKAVDSLNVDWNEQAAKKAESYLDFMAFSRSGLIDQLKYEGFDEETAAKAVDSLNVDWNEQAAKKAKSYLELMAFSRSRLIEQLKFDGFTDEQATYGAAANGY